MLQLKKKQPILPSLKVKNLFCGINGLSYGMKQPDTTFLLGLI